MKIRPNQLYTIIFIIVSLTSFAVVGYGWSLSERQDVGWLDSSVRHVDNIPNDKQDKHTLDINKSEWNIYRSEELGIEFSYPKNLYLHESDKSKSVFPTTSPGVVAPINSVTALFAVRKRLWVSFT